MISKSCWQSEVPKNFSKNMDSQAENTLSHKSLNALPGVYVFQSLTGNPVIR